jgi:hypothetical protein
MAIQFSLTFIYWQTISHNLYSVYIFIFAEGLRIKVRGHVFVCEGCRFVRTVCKGFPSQLANGNLLYMKMHIGQVWPRYFYYVCTRSARASGHICVRGIDVASVFTIFQFEFWACSELTENTSQYINMIQCFIIYKLKVFRTRFQKQNKDVLHFYIRLNSTCI